MLEDQQDEPLAPDLSHLITEDDTPVDNRYSERQMTLLSLPLFDSWEQGKPFEALTDVGLFSKPDNESVVVPDFLLSLGVEPREVTGDKENRSYFVWLYGKPPNLVVEIVSNKVGGELERKLETYQRIGVAYYAVYDPFRHLGKRELRLFQLSGGRYVEMADPHTIMPEIGLGLTFWEGTFLDAEARWLRFVDDKGELILTGQEAREGSQLQADAAKAEAEEAKAEAEEAKAEAAQAQARARELEAELAALKAQLEE